MANNIYTLFNVNDDGTISKLEPHQMLNPWVKQVYDRDKGSVKDSTGRKKRKALAELLYVWCMADIKSPARVRGLSKKEANKIAIDYCGLDDNYKPDELIEALIEDYRENSGGPYAKALITLLSTLGNITTTIELIDIRVKEALAEVSNPTSSESLNISITSAMGYSTDILKIASELPKYRKSIQAAIDAAIAEEEEEIAWGDVHVTDSMRPDKLKI